MYTTESSQNCQPKAKTISRDSIGKTRNTKLAIDVFKSLDNMLREGLSSNLALHVMKIIQGKLYIAFVANYDINMCFMWATGFLVPE